MKVSCRWGFWHESGHVSPNPGAFRPRAPHCPKPYAGDEPLVQGLEWAGVTQSRPVPCHRKEHSHTQSLCTARRATMSTCPEAEWLTATSQGAREAARVMRSARRAAVPACMRYPPLHLIPSLALHAISPVCALVVTQHQARRSLELDW